MGSGSSAQKETQSAPATARTTPKPAAPKRNRQFEEVQLAPSGQGGANPRSRGQSRSQGPSPHPGQTSTRTPRQDPSGAASSSTSTSRPQQQGSTRQGAAANGKKQNMFDEDFDVMAGTPTEPQSQDRTTGGRMPAAQGTVKPAPISDKLFANAQSTKHSNQDNEGIHGNGRITGKPPPNPRNTTQTSFQVPPQKVPHYSNSDVSRHESRRQTDGQERQMNAREGQGRRSNGNARRDGSNNDLGKGKRSQIQPSRPGGMTNGIPRARAHGRIDEEDEYDDNDDNDDDEIYGDNISFDEGQEDSENDHSTHGDGYHSNDDVEDEMAEIVENRGKQERARKQQKQGEQKVDNVTMKEEDIVFETFYHRSGKEFQCIYQSGMRFYLDDWGSKEWQPFPKRWYNEGLLVTNTILKDDSQDQNGQSNDQAGASGQGTSSRSRGQGSRGGGGGSDDREGFLMHPTKGRIPTYIFYKKHNVHMYFDQDSGAWVRMPIGWELHHNMVKSLVDQVEEAVPTWNDRHDILSLLRACNYDPDECISIYLHLEKDEWMKAPKTAKESKALNEKENRMAELEEKVRGLEIELQKERNQRIELERNLEELTNKNTEQEAEFKEMEAQFSAVTGGRPMSARPISRMVKGGARGGKGGARGQSRAAPTPVKENVNPDDILDLNANAKELRKAHARLKVDVERALGNLKAVMVQIGPTIKKMKVAEKSSSAEIEEVRALYRKEALQRRLLYNQLQEMRGNIRVFCRVRKDDRAELCLKFPSDQDIIAQHAQQGKKMFNFDKVFDPASTQEQVFEDTKPIITSCADGYNVCLLAYGQTGSGKTFTMMGPESNPGINIRAMKELFKVCDERKETMDYVLTVSLVEIYNETIQDLLTTDAKTLDLRTAGNKVNIPGLTEYPIKGVKDVKDVMAMGDKNRSVAETKMNSTSSRSHLVLMLSVEGHDKVTKAITKGTLVLCDLAGSERIGKTEAEGQRLVEAAAINKSLSALGQVFTALRTSQLHVPYRNSKLTQILQPSLGGDAKACLFVNVSPDVYNFSETVSTLTFGSNARQVALGQAKQNISKAK